MQGELVSILTEDKVRLDGFFAHAAPARPANTVQAAILVHGLSGNFYKSRLLKHFAAVLRAQDISVLLVNTRGHDYLNATPRMGKTQTIGAAFEIIDQCKYDLYAWAQYLSESGFANIMALGHSLGAIKSLYAQAHHPHPSVKRIAAYSATKLSYNSLLESSGGDRFAHWITSAQKLVEANRGDDLMFVDFPFPTWISANAYLNKYGDRDRYNWLSFKEQIQVPTLAVFGEREMRDNAAFKVMGPELDAINQENFEVRYIPNADHFYTACFEAASQELLDWLESA